MPLEIVDCHFHFYDQSVNTHPFLETYDPKLAKMWGTDYHKRLPKAYLPKHYLKDMEKFTVKKLVMAELVSTDALKEMQFAQTLSENNPLLAGAIANIDLLDSTLPTLLANYAKLPVVKAVRDHLLWDANNPGNCYTRRADILAEPMVEKSFLAIEHYGFNFEFEVYSHDIPHVRRYAKQFPRINFVLHCLGWPLNQTQTGFEQWKQEIETLSECQNVFVKITAIECIFGLDWTTKQVKPWISTIIDIFGAERCMFGSHLPIANLSHGVGKLFEAYQESVRHFTEVDKKQLFSETACRFYNI